jgi:mono/diheme cytochrome c family protein/rhodanese-related sulfurtransferase
MTHSLRLRMATLTQKQPLSRLFTHLLLLVLLVSSCTESNSRKPYLLGIGYGISSLSLVVNDLEATREYFQDTLGFLIRGEVEKGMYGGTRSLAIAFADMSALEIVALNDTLADELKPAFLVSFLKKYEGIRSYTLSSSSVDSTAMWLQSQGFISDTVRAFRMSEEVSTGWSRDDGGPQFRTLDFAEADPPAHLPRFLEETTNWYKLMRAEWLSMNAYQRVDLVHPNGALGIAAIRIAVADLKASRKEFNKMGFTELEATDTLVRFSILRNQELHVVTSKNPTSAITDFLQTRGSGVFALRFEVSNLDSTYHYLKNRLPAEALRLEGIPARVTVLSDYAHGVQLEFVAESEAQAQIAARVRPKDVLDSASAQYAADLYTKYCALCHGADREGYAADNAPSLRSHSLLTTSKGTNFMRYTIQYGRANTAMAGYLKRQGGPLEYIEIELLMQWLYEKSGAKEPIELPRDPIVGDEQVGSALYAQNCAVCHGASGEGISAPALGNPMLLATATDHFLRYAITEGRDGTPMVAFKDLLGEEKIDAIVAFLRSRASGWNIPERSTVTVPTPENYIMNPNGKAPTFTLRENKYVSAVQVAQALKDSARMVMLDARSEVAWRQMHIPGSIPVPYYEEPENFVNDLPNDSTWIVVYCACPHAASQRVVSTLNRHGFKRSVILDEGILVWAQMGFPVEHGE